MRVNGQLVTFSLDGLEVPASLALQSLANGSATVDYRFTDRTILGQLGIFEVRIPGSNTAATPPAVIQTRRMRQMTEWNTISVATSGILGLYLINRRLRKLRN